MNDDRYSKEDSGNKCDHCSTGIIYGNLCGVIVIHWCNVCGANNRKKAPNVKVTFSKS